jgi:signal transduction histidine kinase
LFIQAATIPRAEPMNQIPFVQYTRNSLFRNIPRELLRQEKVVSSSIAVEPGTVIFEEGAPPDYCYLVGSGAVRISTALPDGRAEILGTVGPGDFFGELALYDSATRSARATAVVPTRLGRVDLKGFAYLREVAPLQIATNLAERAIERVRRTNIQLVADLTEAGRLTLIGSDLAIHAHDLRSPLTTIWMAADMLHDEMSHAASTWTDVTKFVEMIRRTANNGLAYIDELMARVSGDEVGTVRVTVESLLQDLRQLTAGYFMNPKIRYHDEKVSYHGDMTVERSELVYALTNLVKNAVEALPDAGGDIDVSVAAEGKSVVFSVSDTGNGIEPELLPVLFERGFTHGKKGGTGLGLAHVWAVAEKHGGQVYVESEVGKGTTFRICIPNPN